MKSKPSSMGRGAVGLIAVTVMAASGCARLVVADPGTIAQRNDSAWQLRPSPPSGAAGAVPAENPPAAVVTPLPPATPPPAERATPLIPKAVLMTPPDRYGIPQGLYQQDPMLVSYLEVARARAASHHAAGGGAIAFAGVAAGISALLFWRASANADAAAQARRDGQTVTNDPSGYQYVLGTVDGGLALGFLVYGIVDLMTGTDPSALRRYSHETYGVP